MFSTAPFQSRAHWISRKSTMRLDSSLVSNVQEYIIRRNLETGFNPIPSCRISLGKPINLYTYDRPNKFFPNYHRSHCSTRAIRLEIDQSRVERARWRGDVLTTFFFTVFCFSYGSNRAIQEIHDSVNVKLERT